MLRRHGMSLLRTASRARTGAALSAQSTAWSSANVSALRPWQTVRFCSSASTDEPKQEPTLVYEGPMARTVRIMKGVSVTSCILTSIGMPTLCMISEQSASVVGKWAMCGTVMLFGLGTTSLFHYLFKPYVIRMWLARDPVHPEKSEVTVQTVTLFAQLTKSSFLLGETAPPAKSMHPMLSFQARGKDFFIHPECFEDRDLVEKLTGQPAPPLPESEEEDN